ncbi:PREDICTED: uncharacterized protein LOC109168210 [Ipomoea nil]|uniref:uncharacterized protein LOC109168210 n=1 Tax=Ipomoea nil TaxID=35883 RepID=UPI000901A99A|nr:PREDICTED: uncharacterized protein LOC109168210 [Ipomoea nil]
MQQINRQSATSRCCRRRRRSDATSRSLSLPPLLTQQINRQSATSRFRRRHTYWELKKWTVDLNQYACESLRLNHPETNVTLSSLIPFLFYVVFSHFAFLLIFLVLYAFCRR